MLDLFGEELPWLTWQIPSVGILPSLPLSLE
jgi:hypothetical protein